MTVSLGGSRKAFAYCSLKAIAIPKNVEIIGAECFRDCKQLATVSFEADSHLLQIEAMAFTNTAIPSVELPEHVVSVFSTALPEVCRIICPDGTFPCASFKKKVGTISAEKPPAE
jgi:hypothetical protein